MNKIKAFFSILVIMFAFTLCLSSKIVFAKSNYVNNLKIKIDKTITMDMNQSINKIYKNNIAPSIIIIKKYTMNSDVSDQAINDATLSAPIPVFSPDTKYNKGEDFKSKLTHSGWQFIVYADSNPIAGFFINKKYIVTKWFNENQAKSFLVARTQLNGNSLIVLPVSGYLFLADTDDNVAHVVKQNRPGVKYDVKTFDEFNNATNKSRDYDISQPDMLGAGIKLLDYIYGDNRTNSLTSPTYVIVYVIGFACLVLATILFRNRKLKFKNN